jgi:multimeric flavodoxin WrbA
MKILVVDGKPVLRESGFSGRIRKVAEILSLAEHDVEVIILAEKKITECTGCFSCWLRTPGLCIFNDDHAYFLKSFIKSDLVLFASPLIMGFPSALLKTAIDRFIPTALPYIELADGECRHPLRYGNSPAFALLYEPELDTDEEDLRVVTTVFERFARNAHTEFVFARPLGDDPEVVRNAIEHI